MSAPRPTIRDIAAKSGFSKSHVAQVLRDSKKVLPETRERILAVAHSLGYRNDARMRQLMAYLRQGKSRTATCNLAWVNTWPDRDAWQNRSYMRVFFEGAQARAEELGYVLDPIWSADPAVPPRRLNGILESRGVQGLIIPVPINDQHLFEIDFSRYATVALSHSERELQVHRTGPSWASNTALAVTRLHALGYRRLILATRNQQEWDSSHLISAVFWRTLRRLGLPCLQELPPEMDDEPPVEELVRRYKPDAVICATNDTVGRIEALGLRVPQDVGVVHLLLGPDVPDWAGIDPKQQQLAAAAVDLVDAHLKRNELGLPATIREVLIEGTWTDGRTAPPRPADPPPKRRRAR